jgi:hypothetical protein
LSADRRFIPASLLLMTESHRIVDSQRRWPATF